MVCRTFKNREDSYKIIIEKNRKKNKKPNAERGGVTPSISATDV
jgi:hypothetical protein